jgi:hypothetical protein
VIDTSFSRPNSLDRIKQLQFLQTFSNLTVASVVVAATELSIQWNNLTDVNDVSTAGQTIPVIIAAGLVARVFYVFFWPDHDKEVSSHFKWDTSTDTTERVILGPGHRPPNVHDLVSPQPSHWPPAAGHPPRNPGAGQPRPEAHRLQQQRPQPRAP